MINCKYQLDCWEEECSKCDGTKECKEPTNMKTEFFMPMRPPTTTHQEKQVAVVNGKPQFYEPAELKAARVKLMAYLSKHVPSKKYTGGVRLVTKWCFPNGKHPPGTYKTTKPDTDNLQKLLKDVMTDLNYWTDDSLVASEIVEKFYSKIPGIYISIEELV
jgi:Holliday junction resolvase RusA-like endonuclease